MPKNKNELYLSTREMDVMNVLWSSNDPLLASDVAKTSELSINTVQAVLKNLLNQDLIEVADIVHSGTVLSRRYRPTIGLEDYTISQFTSRLTGVTNHPFTPRVVACLLDHEPDLQSAIEGIEKLINERKKQLKKG